MIYAKSHGIEELTRPQRNGRAINRHVVRHQPEPLPDYEKMRRLANQQGRQADE